MFTSRAEYRLLLREDNADVRLRSIGHGVGAVDDLQLSRTTEKCVAVESEIERLESLRVVPVAGLNERLRQLESTPLFQATSAAQLLRRPGITYPVLVELGIGQSTLAADVAELVEVEIKYAGYIKRQQDAIDRASRLESAMIPTDMDFSRVMGLSREAQEKLTGVRPKSLGQAARIPGITPAALSLLSVHLKRHGRLRPTREAS
jgi:tRNA uridine 5-carboxymethylaminomethyl modification enzyme